MTVTQQVAHDLAAFAVSTGFDLDTCGTMIDFARSLAQKRPELYQFAFSLPDSQFLDAICLAGELQSKFNPIIQELS